MKVVFTLFVIVYRKDCIRKYVNIEIFVVNTKRTKRITKNLVVYFNVKRVKRKETTKKVGFFVPTKPIHIKS